MSGYPQDLLAAKGMGCGWHVTAVGCLLLGTLGPAPGQSVSASTAGLSQTLSLSESVELALQHNKTIQSAYLDRIAQQFDLRVAEDKFTPKFLMSPGIDRTQSSNVSASVPSTTTTTNPSGAVTSLGMSGAVNQALVSGARVSLSANQASVRTVGGDPYRSSGWNLSLIQPLLKGAGADVANASVVVARYAEQANVLALKAVITDTLTEVGTAYRAYFKTVKALAINQQSVRRSKDLLTINRNLIAAGRMAEVDIVQSEADVANQEFNLTAAEGAVDSARLALLKVLGLSTQTRVLPQDRMDMQSVHYEYAQALDMALQNRADYLSGMLSVEVARTRLMLAQNNLLPDLSVSGGYSQAQLASNAPGLSSNGSNWSVGLRLTVPLGDLSLQQVVVQTKVDLEKAELSLKKLRESIEIDIQNALRNVDISLRQVKLAERARELAEKKFAVETEKLKVGRSSNFQLVLFQNDLVNAQNSELNTTIGYLDALSALENKLGIVLDTWGVSLVRR